MKMLKDRQIAMGAMIANEQSESKKCLCQTKPTELEAFFPSNF